MCVKLLPRNLNPGLYPQHPTNIYTCRVTTTLRVRSGLPIFQKQKTLVGKDKLIIKHLIELNAFIYIKVIRVCLYIAYFAETEKLLLKIR